MSALLCRQSLLPCQTPGMCSPHGGCQDKVPIAVVSDYSDLQRLCLESRENTNFHVRMRLALKFDEVLALIADNGRLAAQVNALQQRLNIADQRVDDLTAENAALCLSVKRSAMRIKELDLLFGRYLIGMRSAVIELDYGDGPEAAMRWIRNGLIGPGQLPPDDAFDAQAYFDREIVAIDAGMQEVLAFFDPKAAEVPL